MIDWSKIILDIETGMVLYGSIKLFPFKLIYYYVGGGISSMFAYWTKCRSRKEKVNFAGAIYAFCAGILSIFLVVGFFNSLGFDSANYAYIYFLIGFYSERFLTWIQEHGEQIVEKLLNKGVNKALGTDVNYRIDEEKKETKIDDKKEEKRDV